MSDHQVAQTLTGFANLLAIKPLPDDVARYAKTRVIDTLAVGVAGASRPSVERVVKALVSEHNGGPRSFSQVWATGQTTTPGTAALVNAVASHAEDFDDTHTGAVMHGSACVVPAAWAVAEADDLSWGQLIVGVVAGWEVAARIGQASEGAFHRRGMHPTSIGGIFGSAFAISVMRKYDPDTMLNAMGLCGSAVSGLNAYLQNGSDGKLLNPGFAVRAAIDAAALAEAGVTGPHDVLQGRHGVFEALGDGGETPLKRFATFGEQWEINAVSIKPFPACHFTHASIDCALDLYAEGIVASEIEHIQIRLPEATWDLVTRPWEAKLAPRSSYEVRFSIPWLVALGLLDGDVRRSTFTDHLTSRADVRDLVQRVSVVPWTQGGYPYAFPGEVQVRMSDGTTFTQAYRINRGHPDRPLDDPDLTAKVRDCLSDTGADAETYLAVLNGAVPEASVRGLRAKALDGLFSDKN